MQDKSNFRTDCYGGSLENRARLLLEVTKTICEVWGSDRVGVHLAPRCDAQSMGDSNPLATFSYVARELAKLKIAFIFSRAIIGEDNLAATLKQEFGGNYIINQNLGQAEANLAIQQGYADAAAWGQLFIANPDLVTRFINGAELNQANPDTFYTGGSKGYTDYPHLS